MTQTLFNLKVCGLAEWFFWSFWPHLFESRSQVVYTALPILAGLGRAAILGCVGQVAG